MSLTGFNLMRRKAKAKSKEKSVISAEVVEVNEVEQPVVKQTAKPKTETTSEVVHKKTTKKK